MGNAELSAPVLARYQIEEAWRARLEQALERYQAATHAYRKLLREEAGGRPPSPDSPLVQARQAESDALMEYSRVLRIFTHLTIHGTLPDEALDVFAISSEEGANKRISVVDDDESIRDATKALLRSAGYQVTTYASAELFLNLGDPAETECIVLDVRMPGMDGLELQRRLKDMQSPVPIVFLTAHDDARSRRLALDAGAVDFLSKPFEANSLVAAVQNALTRQSVQRRGA